ncbi:MAG: hypothetical protein IPM74_12365 [Crocinitomicaceae bacterium]|nr:hypothetical protein [Crocinitomicaceae bacterium]MBK8926669.1 hypothetical protein [Crocinitomicaceae bacterium]
MQNKFSALADFIILAKKIGTNNVAELLIPSYFEQIIDGMVYELYFPDLIKKHEREIIKHLGQLPEFTDDMSDSEKMKICKEVFERLNDSSHLVKQNLGLMKEIPEIKLIEGDK